MNTAWTPEDDAALKELARLGKRSSEISQILNRSIGSVRMRAARLRIEVSKLRKITACPAWLELNEDRTEILLVPERAAVVRMIFEMSVAGLGGYTIAKRLNAQSVPVFGPSPTWDQSTIHNLLRNRATLGELQPKRYEKRNEAPRDRKGTPEGDVVQDYYPKVIDEELFERAQIVRRTNLAHRRGRKGEFITNLFGGVATCAYCFAPVRFHSNGPAKSFICSNVLAGKDCHRFGWSYRNFEQSFFALIRSLAESSNLGRTEQQSVAILTDLIGKLSEPEVVDVRLDLSAKLRSFSEELKIWSCGPHPGPIDLTARIRRNHPDRMFSATLSGGASHEGLPVD